MKTIELCPLGQRIYDEAVLSASSHSAPADPSAGPCEECVMELAAHLAIVCNLHDKATWTDHDPTVCPVIGDFLRSWNDSLNNEDRQMLKPCALLALGTKGSKALESKRAWMATDWLVREYCPAWLDLANLNVEAAALREVTELTDTRTANLATPALNTANSSAAAAWDAVGDAAWDALRPTVETLQQSALRLLDRMIEATV
jgi:hypothetical protein